VFHLKHFIYLTEIAEIACCDHKGAEPHEHRERAAYSHGIEKRSARTESTDLGVNISNRELLSE